MYIFAIVVRDMYEIVHSCCGCRLVDSALLVVVIHVSALASPPAGRRGNEFVVDKFQNRVGRFQGFETTATHVRRILGYMISFGLIWRKDNCVLFGKKLEVDTIKISTTAHA